MTARQRKMLRRRRRLVRRARKRVRLIVRATQLRIARAAGLTSRAALLAGRGVDRLLGLAERLLDYLDDSAKTKSTATATKPTAAAPNPTGAATNPTVAVTNPTAATTDSPLAANGAAAPKTGPKKRVSKPRARCVVVVEKKSKKKSARSHGGGKRLAVGVDGIRRINITRKFVASGADDERPSAFLRNLLIELVFPDVLTRGRRLQELLRKLLREVVAGARRTAVWIREKCVGVILAAAAWASRFLADLHHRLPSLVPLTDKRKPARARGNRPRPSTGPSP